MLSALALARRDSYTFIGTQDSSKSLVDIAAKLSESEIISIMAELLQDGLGSSVKISTTNEDILLSTPFSKTLRDMYLLPKQNTFWFTRMPQELEIQLVSHEKDNTQHYPVKIIEGERLDFESYNTVLKDKVEYFMKRLRVLKVVNTPESQQEVNRIVLYFQQLDKCFELNEPSVVDILNNHNLRSRGKSKLPFAIFLC